jgi:hypothetical protein
MRTVVLERHGYGRGRHRFIRAFLNSPDTVFLLRAVPVKCTPVFGWTQVIPTRRAYLRIISERSLSPNKMGIAGHSSWRACRSGAVAGRIAPAGLGADEPEARRAHCASRKNLRLSDTAGTRSVPAPMSPHRPSRRKIRASIHLNGSVSCQGDLSDAY